MAKFDYEIKFAVTDPDEIVKLALVPENKGDIWKIIRIITGEQMIGLCPWGSCQYAFDNVTFDTLCTIMKTKSWTYDELVANLEMPWKIGEPVLNPFLSAKLAIIKRESVNYDGYDFDNIEDENAYWNSLFHSTTFEELFTASREAANHLSDPTSIIFKAVFPNAVGQEDLSIGEMLFILHAKGYVKDPSCYVDFDT